MPQGVTVAPGIELIAPQRTGDRDNVPPGVDPDDVILHGKRGDGQEFWVEKKLLRKARTYVRTESSHEASNPMDCIACHRTKTSKLSFDRPKRSYAWVWIALVVGVTVLAAGKTFGWMAPAGKLLSGAWVIVGRMFRKK